MKTKLLILSLTILCATAILTTLPQGVSTYGKGYFVEGFNAPLNSTIWKVCDYPTAYAWHKPEFVSVSNSLLKISIPGGQRVGGGIRSNKLYSYGLFGARFKAAITPTSDSGFCLYYKDSTMSGCDQIAVEVFGNIPTKLSVGMWRLGKRERVMVNLGFDATKAFHDYEFTWSASQVQFYVDAKLVATLSDLSCLPVHSQYLLLGAFSWSGFLDPPSSISGRCDIASCWIDRLPKTLQVASSNVLKVQTMELYGSIGENFATTASSINPSNNLTVNYERSKFVGNILAYKDNWTFTYKTLNSQIVNVTQTTSQKTYWFTVNKTDRWIGQGSSWWNLSWFIGWIPTDVYVGLRLKWWMAKGTVLSSSNVTVSGKSVLTWQVDGTYPDSPYPITAYYSKETGILVKLVMVQNSITYTLALK